MYSYAYFHTRTCLREYEQAFCFKVLTWNIQRYVFDQVVSHLNTEVAACKCFGPEQKP